MPVANWRYTWTVRGQSAFPLDMLRYDCCWPADEASGLAIQTSFALWGEGPRARGEQLEVRVASWARDPTEARWESFGWTVAMIHPRERRL